MIHQRKRNSQEVPPSKAAVPAPSEMENEKVWTPEEVSRAEQARYMHHPSDESLTWLFENGLVLGCAH